MSDDITIIERAHALHFELVAMDGSWEWWRAEERWIAFDRPDHAVRWMRCWLRVEHPVD